MDESSQVEMALEHYVQKVGFQVDRILEKRGPNNKPMRHRDYPGARFYAFVIKVKGKVRSVTVEVFPQDDGTFHVV